MQNVRNQTTEVDGEEVEEELLTVMFTVRLCMCMSC